MNQTSDGGKEVKGSNGRINRRNVITSHRTRDRGGNTSEYERVRFKKR